MAVQAHYGSNILLLNRSEQEKKEMDSSPQAATRDGANKEARKRGREAAGVPMAPSPPPQQQQQSRLLSFLSMKPQPCSPAPVSIAELQMHPPSQVSLGLRLTAEEKRRHRRETQSNPLLSSASSSSVLHEELVALVNHQRDEIETLLLAQEEQLRRALAERRQRQYRALLNAAEESAARRLREKEAEVGRLARRRGELEKRLALLRTETMAWQAKAMADQVTAAALNAQLEKAAAAPERKEMSGDSPPAEDAESGFEDPDRVERERACRSCQYRRASVVLLPCRHLCLCDACDAASDSCPVCRCVTTGSVRVLLS
ncbi:BOI-related E3 ubiquitin-protein ligase 1-like isoform X2 [Musa acuminata AAA Group]|uniref:BOI-related E3 ubiquitin-protein ligase 1 isoform X2 n=1 Tax=Musa acuminata AAA Group TaxID=214697 RepID=UPI0031DCF21C